MTDKLYERIKNYVNVDPNHIGGYIEIFQLEDQLYDFTRDSNLGFIQILDMVLYEFRKYSDILGTRRNLDLDTDEYSKYMRNLFPTFAYRLFGFRSLYAIRDYLCRFYNKRNLDIDIIFLDKFYSLDRFKNTVNSILEEEHCILVEDRNLDSKCRFYNIIHIDSEYIYIILNGELERIYLSNYGINNISILYLDIHI